MMDLRRNQLAEFVEKEFIGPDPIDFEGYKQENGEEILVSDPPRTRYIAGILFPREVKEDESAEIKEGEMEDIDLLEMEDDGEVLPQSAGDIAEYLEDAEELINRSNAYRQSAISMTVAINTGDQIRIEVSAGKYKTLSFTDSKSGKQSTHYPRTAIEWNNNNNPLELPSVEEIGRASCRERV